jgi:outer membrane protein assembly factor BamA
MLMCIAIQGKLKAQNPYRLVIHAADKDSLFLNQELVLKTSFLSKLQCQQYIEGLRAIMQAKGYISSSVDSISFSGTHADVFLFVGEQYREISLKIRNGDKRYLEENGWNLLAGKNNSIPFRDYQLLSDKLLDYFEDRGYPFAKISLDSVSVKSGQINGVLNIDKGFPYHIDSIRTFGPAKISKNFIHRYLGIERGSLYSRGKLDKVNQRLLELPYLQQSQPWDLTMLNTGALLNL